MVKKKDEILKREEVVDTEDSGISEFKKAIIMVKKKIFKRWNKGLIFRFIYYTYS